MYVVSISGTLGTEEPNYSGSDPFLNGSATLIYICNCAKLKIIK